MWFRWMSTLLKVITIFNKFIGSRSRRFRIANTIGVDDFQGGVRKRLHFRFKYFSLSPKRWKWFGKWNPENTFWTKQNKQKRAYHEAKHSIKWFWRKARSLLSAHLRFIFLFSAAPTKIITFQNVHFHHFAPSGNDLLRSAHFRCRAFDKDHLSKGTRFHGLVFPDCWEISSNVCNNTFAKCFRGILFWELRRNIYFFAKLRSIFFPLCDFISQLCRHALASLIGWDGRTTGATFYKLSETSNRQGSWKLLIVIKGYDELYTSFTKSGKGTKDCNNYQPPVSGKKRSKPGQLHLFPIPWLPQR